MGATPQPGPGPDPGRLTRKAGRLALSRPRLPRRDASGSLGTARAHLCCGCRGRPTLAALPAPRGSFSRLGAPPWGPPARKVNRALGTQGERVGSADVLESSGGVKDYLRAWFKLARSFGVCALETVYIIRAPFTLTTSERVGESETARLFVDTVDVDFY